MLRCCLLVRVLSRRNEALLSPVKKRTFSLIPGSHQLNQMKKRNRQIANEGFFGFALWPQRKQSNQMKPFFLLFYSLVLSQRLNKRKSICLIKYCLISQDDKMRTERQRKIFSSAAGWGCQGPINNLGGAKGPKAKKNSVYFLGQGGARAQAGPGPGSAPGRGDQFWVQERETWKEMRIKRERKKKRKKNKSNVERDWYHVGCMWYRAEKTQKRKL